MDMSKAADTTKKAWQMFRRHANETPKDWAAIVAESDKIAESIRGDNAASHILHGFLLALEAEDMGGKS